MLETFENIMPEWIDDKIVNKLKFINGWTISDDRGVATSTRGEDALKDNGMLLCTYSTLPQGVTEDERLNELAKLIFERVLDTAETKFSGVEIARFLWNYYNIGSTGTEHVDYGKPHEHTNWASIVYYPHTNDGGTWVDDEFYPSKRGSAVMFDSYSPHRGQGPIESKERWVLNILFKYKDRWVED